MDTLPTVNQKDQMLTIISPPTPEEHLWVCGLIKARLLPPELTEAEFKQWWQRLTEPERDQYTVYEAPNVITTAGRSQLLSYIGDNILVSGNTGTIVPFAQYF